MLIVIRHLLAIAALPFVVAVLIPFWIARTNGVRLALATTTPHLCPYRYVRNPMISGVVFVLFGEALTLLSGPQVQWAFVFLVINLIYIPLLEEQQLKARFGEQYMEYCRHVPRLLPRLRPWTPTASGDSR